MSNGNAASQFVPPRCPIAQALLHQAHVTHAAAREAQDRLEAAFLYQRALELRRRRCRHSDLCVRCFEDSVLEVAA
jgi:hypothetical protein